LRQILIVPIEWKSSCSQGDEPRGDRHELLGRFPRQPTWSYIAFGFLPLALRKCLKVNWVSLGTSFQNWSISLGAVRCSFPWRLSESFLFSPGSFGGSVLITFSFGSIDSSRIFSRFCRRVFSLADREHSSLQYSCRFVFKTGLRQEPQARRRPGVLRKRSITP